MTGDPALEKETRWNIVRRSTTGQSDTNIAIITCTEVKPLNNIEGSQFFNVFVIISLSFTILHKNIREAND